MNLSAPEFIDYRDQNRIFEQIAAIRGHVFNLGEVDKPEQLYGQRVSASFFLLLGIEPALGRSFLAEEDQPGKDHVVVLSYRLWQRRFAGDPNLIGRVLKLNGESYTVVGIMPQGFRFPPFSGGPELWKPIAFSAQEGNGEDKEARMTHGLDVLGRLKPKVSLEQAQAEMERLALELQRRYPHLYTDALGWGATVEPLHENLVGNVRPALLVLLGAAGCVLLIACANVASLLLARAADRRREIAIRTALGAGRLRLIRQLLTESLLLSMLGAGIGLLAAFWCLGALVAAIPTSLPRLYEISIDGPVLGFTLLVSGLTGIIFGLAPALGTSKPNLQESLKEGGRTGSAGSGRQRVLDALVVSEVALALVLLTGAGLLMKSFFRLLQVNPGFNPQNVLTLFIDLPEPKYREPDKIVAFYRQALQRIETLPGVQVAGAITDLPLSGSESTGAITVEDLLSKSGPPWREVAVRMVTPNYFASMQLPLLKGRYFTERDAAQAPGVAIMDQTLARKLWPGEEPLGKRVRLGTPEFESPWLSIVGVVGHVKHSALDADSREQFYMPHMQAHPLWMNVAGRRMTLVVRTATEPLTLAAAVQREIWAMDKDQPVSSIQTLEQVVSQSLVRQRFNLMVLGIFAFVALVLGAAGIYGVIAYAVHQRTHEIGIRMALGARQGDVFRLILKHGLLLALIGLGLGQAGSIALSRFLSSQLYEVSSIDPATFASVSLLLCGVALLACYIPARRATQVDPMVALRYE